MRLWLMLLALRRISSPSMRNITSVIVVVSLHHSASSKYKVPWSFFMG
jgi:hypothetical protein